MTNSTAKWFAVMVKPRFEKSIAAILRSKGYEEFSPVVAKQQNWSDRVKTVEFPLFPRYLFCRFSFEQRLPVMNTPGILRIVGFGPTPCDVPDAEIEALRIAVRAGVPLENCEYISVGQRVRIVKGPLVGAEGIYWESKAHSRVVLSIHLLQRSVYVEVDRSITVPLDKRPLVAPALIRPTQSAHYLLP